MSEPQNGTPPQPVALPAKTTSDLSPWRLRFTIAALWVSLFLAALESTIVTTALLKIGDAFKEYSNANWIVVTYLLTYNAFLLVIGNLSDIFGVKTMLLISHVIFLAFSMACGVSQTMTQLIIFRALQGIGGSGLYSLVWTFLGKHVPLEKLGEFSGAISSVFAASSLLGPVLGGIITDHTTWRWVFFLNGPGVAVALALIIFAVPNMHGSTMSKESLRRFDLLGGFLSVAWAVLLVFGLQEGDINWPWTSGPIIGTLVGGSVGLVVFLLWQAWVQKRGTMNPIFPVKFLRDPVQGFQFLTMLLMGCSLFSAVILLPQRFQSVNQTSASRAGVLLLPLTVLTAVASFPAANLPTRRRNLVFPIIISGTVFTAIGMGLLSALPTDHDISALQYAAQVILGIGIGFQMPTLLFIIKLDVSYADMASVIGASNMCRTLGGCLALAIATATQHSYFNSELPKILKHNEVDLLLDSVAYVDMLPDPMKRIEVRRLFGESYNRQFQALMAFAIAGVLSSCALAFFHLRKLNRADAAEETPTEVEAAT